MDEVVMACGPTHYTGRVCNETYWQKQLESSRAENAAMREALREIAAVADMLVGHHAQSITKPDDVRAILSELQHSVNAWRKRGGG